MEDATAAVSGAPPAGEGADGLAAGWRAVLDARRTGRLSGTWPAEAPDWLRRLYLPLALQPFIVAHLGQSLDGFIATASGDSCYVTGPENLDHLHRMRALADAIVVGAGTVAQDDPWLTTRRVPGGSPVRVVLDPDRRLDPGHRLFADGTAPTLVICRRDVVDVPASAGMTLVGVPAGKDGLAPGAVLKALSARGFGRIFVEGGGVTVSRFLAAGVLDRLQIAVAPLIVGSGRRGVELPPAAGLDDALRPACRTYAMGADVLFDLDLRGGRPQVSG